MRIVMPLFQFSCLDIDHFVFAGNQLTLQKFLPDNDIPDVDLFSRQDLQYMDLESWAIVFDDDDIEEYKSKVNLLLLSFRLFSKGKPPFIKYRLCKDDIRLCRRLTSTMTYIHEFENQRLPYSRDDIEIVDKGFQSLMEMDGVSTRTHNALYFHYLAFQTTHWIPSFMFLMNALEALFSKDKSGGATRTICTRVSSFLGSKSRCKYEDIENLYEIRSRIVHGNLVASKAPGENLKHLEQLRFIAIECMRKFLTEKAYLHFKDKKARDSYFSTFN